MIAVDDLCRASVEGFAPFQRLSQSRFKPARLTGAEKLLQYMKSGRGRRVSLARELGIKHTAFYSWKRVPAERVLDIERITGIGRHELRPDLFTTPEVAE